MSSSGNVSLFSRLRNSIKKGFSNFVQQNKYLKSASYVIPRIKDKITNVLQANIVKVANNITKFGGVVSKKYKKSINKSINKKLNKRKNKKNTRNQASKLNRTALSSIEEYDIYVRYQNDIYNQINFTMSDKIDIIRSCLKEYNSLKINEQIKIVFKKITPDAENTYQTTEFIARSPVQTITDPDYHDIMYMLETTRDNIEARISKFTFEGSAWVLDKILEHNLIISKYNPLRGSSYIPLPDKYLKRKACVNIQNKDDKCFIYCLARALDKEPEKIHSRTCIKTSIRNL